jgi:hypothetical protein
MYTQKFVQTGNSCGAATLMIALHEFDSKNKIDATTEASLYANTRDPVLAGLLGQTKVTDYSSSPANIKKTAESNGLKATLCEKDDIGALPADVKQLKAAYIDSLHPAKVDSSGMKNLMDKGPLQLLVYLNGDQKQMHWLLLRKDSGKYYLYDTAYGTNQEVNADNILKFDAQFQTGRQNNFFGVAFQLTKT